MKKLAQHKLVHFQNRKLVLQRVRLHFGLSSDTKIIFSKDQVSINLSHGKIAVLNSDGTQLICTVNFFNHPPTSDSSNPDPEISASIPPPGTFSSQSPQLSLDFKLSQELDPVILEKKIDELNTFHNSFELHPFLISQNCSSMFPILFFHALARGKVKTNSAVKGLPPHLRQGTMYALGYRSEAMIGRHQQPNKFIGKFSPFLFLSFFSVLSFFFPNLSHISFIQKILFFHPFIL